MPPEVTTPAVPATPDPAPTPASEPSATPGPSPTSSAAPAAPAVGAPSKTSPVQTDAQPSGGERSTAGEGSAPPAPTDADPEDERRRWLSELDPRDIARLNRKFAGFLGSEADRLERMREPDRRRTWEQLQRDQRERDELLELREKDPFEYVQKEKELEERWNTQQAQLQQQQASQQAFVANWDAALLDMYEGSPEGVRKQLAGKRWNVKNDPVLSRQAFLRDFYKAVEANATTTAGESVLQEKLQSELAKAKKDLEEGVRRELMAQVNAGTQKPDPGTGTPVASGAVDQREWQDNRNDRSWRRSNRERIAEGLRLGLIRTDRF